MSLFTDATSVTPTDRPGVWAAELNELFAIGGRPNGGYLLSLLAAACVAESAGEHPHPTSATALYLSSPPPGPCEITVTVLRRGRSSSAARASLVAGGQVCVEVVCTLGFLQDADEPWFSDAPAPVLPPVEDCLLLPPRAPGGEFETPLMGYVLERMDRATMGWGRGRPSGNGELRGWVSFADDHVMDPLALLTVVDCMPPAAFDLGTMGWVPTMSLTAYVRAVPAPGPLAVRQRARVVTGGTMDEICEVWDVRGRLVATGHQLAGLRVPPGPVAPRILAV